MGNFANNAITDAGRMLLADVQAGAVFTPTRIVIGSGSLPSGTTTQSINDVITPVKSLDINKKKRTNDGKCVFGGVYTNEDITTPFYFRELGLYARAVYLNEDGTVKSEGNETLYSYGNAGSTADLMPAYSTSTVVEKQIDLVTWVGNSAQVDLTIESGVYIPFKEKGAPGGVAALDENGSVNIDGVLSVAKGRGAFVTDEISTIMEHRKDSDRFGFVVYPDMTLEERYKVFEEVDGSISQYGILHNGIKELPGKIGGLVDYDLIGNAADFDILEWASEQEYSGTFMVGSHTANLPRAAVFQGLLCVAQQDKFMLIWDNISAYFIATNATQFADNWKSFVTSAGSSNIEGIFGVNNGTGLLFSWELEQYTGVAIDANRKDKVGRLEVFARDDGAEAYVSYFNGQNWSSNAIYHTGNAPAVIATAELA